MAPGTVKAIGLVMAVMTVPTTPEGALLDVAGFSTGKRPEAPLHVGVAAAVVSR